MKPDPLGELLRRADAAAGPPSPLPPDLVVRVQRSAALRRRRIVLVSTAAAVAFLAVGTSLLLRSVEPGQTVAGREQLVRAADSEPDVAQLQAEIARLRAEADSRLAVARRMAELLRRHERLAALAAESQGPDPVKQARQEMDQAAGILVCQADRLHRELHLRARAIESYRAAIRLFPDTAWATVAQERLTKIEQETGETL